MTIYISRVYTKTGDAGMTRLAGGQERRKDDPRLEAYGTVDELNAVLGLAVEEIARSWIQDHSPVHTAMDLGSALMRLFSDPSDASPDRLTSVGVGLLAALRRIQNELFDLGGELATLVADRHPKQALISEADITQLEQEMDKANEYLPPLRSFILPGGGMSSALFHQARTVCRRAERRLFTLHTLEPERPVTIQYLNRLSDWLFVFGRVTAIGHGQGEILWRPGER